MRWQAAVAWALLCALAAGAEPLLESAPTAGGPWTPEARASIVRLDDGTFNVLAPADAAARFYRLVDSEGELAHCPLFVRGAVEMAFLPGDLDGDGDTVPDCDDLCPGHDDRIDENANGIPDDCDAPGMARIPGGSFQMGDSYEEGSADERPAHPVAVSTFFIERFEVTRGLWEDVSAWAVARGYAFEHRPTAAPADSPVRGVDWYDAVKWCNARSEREGLVPCYHTAPDHATVYRSGEVDVASDWVRWDANGYRLATEAEWEKAARGGLEAQRYPWGTAADPTRASFGLDQLPPAGSYPPNGFGLYDIAGSVSEWCWDWYVEDWYGRAEAAAADPHGPVTGSHRVRRGASYSSPAFFLRCAQRSRYEPDGGYFHNGLRCVRGRL